jgi:hypothetical protein
MMLPCKPRAKKIEKSNSVFPATYIRRRDETSQFYTLLVRANRSRAKSRRNSLAANC